MRHLVLIAGAAALAVAGPTLAKPGNGHGNGHENGHGHWNDNGRADYGGGGCPPGLAKKNNGCMPPGQARKLYRGQRYESGYGTLYSYQRIPYDVRRRYRLNSRYRYYYSGGTIYVVDPRTMLISQVVNALLR
jgi:hypothetical protein